MTGEQQYPIRWDLTGEDAIVQGVTWRRYRAITYMVGSTLTVFNTTGYTAQMTIRADYPPSPVLASHTTGIIVSLGALTTSDGQPYSIGITIPQSATTALTDFGIGKWDLILIDSFGSREMVYHGNAALERSVS
jgi:hypothetical protein